MGSIEDKDEDAVLRFAMRLLNWGAVLFVLGVISAMAAFWLAWMDRNGSDSPWSYLGLAGVVAVGLGLVSVVLAFVLPVMAWLSRRLRRLARD